MLESRGSIRTSNFKALFTHPVEWRNEMRAFIALHLALTIATGITLGIFAWRVYERVNGAF